MKIIKLSAIDSTNNFLKELSQNSKIKNFTVVVADKQLQGRGQMGATWLSEPKKNLLCSVFVRFDNFLITQKVLLNYAVSLAIINVLKKYELPALAIKWPNDILSSNKKICGILVENVMQEKYIKSSIIGIGLNINQISFPKEMKFATSIKKEIGEDVNIDDFLEDLIGELKIAISSVTSTSKNSLKKDYLKWLYKRNIPTAFKDSKGVLFMGKIIDVSLQGKLQIQLENDLIKEYGIKEVSFA